MAQTLKEAKDYAAYLSLNVPGPAFVSEIEGGFLAFSVLEEWGWWGDNIILLKYEDGIPVAQSQAYKDLKELG